MQYSEGKEWTMGARASTSALRGSLTLPNVISAARFPLAALVPIAGDVMRIAVVALAAASDWIDGRLARGTGRVTRLGELLDPIADKTFMLVVLITLGVEGALPLWTLPLLLTRDIGVALGALVLAARGRRVRMTARRPGKVVTWLQFFAIGALLIWPPAGAWLAPVVGAAGMYALQDYARAVRSAGGSAQHATGPRS
jgi:CDP-diacylglycerol--glycerol-3-phosphate 3-phosphatidyltransferase/cardiolipin synthase